MSSEIFSLEGKVIVVTGATGILGGAFIEAIAQAGAVVGVLGRNEQVANERVEKINAAGGKAVALIADILDEKQLTAAANTMVDLYGKIDGLVNAAGGNMPEAIVQPGDDLFSLNMEGLQKVMNLNLFGTLLPTQIFGAIMAKSPKASIVNISSVSATTALTRVLGYSLAKSAIDAYTRWFAVELAARYGDQIRMNAIAPGFFLTEQNRTLLTNSDGTLTARATKIMDNTPYKRFGSPSELNGALIWLLSDASTFVSGTITNVDGGFLAFSGV